jgi:hypothetical protein
MKRLSPDGEWVWSSYVAGHELIKEAFGPQNPSAEINAEQNVVESPELPSPGEPQSSKSRDPVSVTNRESGTTTHHHDSSSLNEQTNANPVRDRLTKLFEFLRAYVDLRFPPVRDITQQPRFLWLKDLPVHPSVELFRDR